MEKTTLAEICSADRGRIQTGPFGSQLHQSDYVDSGVPVVMPKDIVDGRIVDDSIAQVAPTTADRLARHYLSEGSIVFPRRGEIGKCGLVSSTQAGYLCGTGCLKIDVDRERLRPAFLYYYLSQRRVIDWVQRQAIGTTMLNLNTGIMGRVPVPMLSLAEQDRILERICPYDDLIDNNRRRIELLEESARRLYREWFVHLRFPGHEHVRIVDWVPEGWSRVPLGELTTLRYGKALKKHDRVEGDCPVFGSSGAIGTHADALVQGPGIVVGRKGTVGSVYWVNGPFWPIDTVYYVDPNTVSFTLYYALVELTFISSDAAVPGLNRNFAHSRTILWPPERLREEFEEFVGPISAQIANLEKQNSRLAAARDLLLPRLMNGEIVV